MRGPRAGDEGGYARGEGGVLGDGVVPPRFSEQERRRGRVVVVRRGHRRTPPSAGATRTQRGPEGLGRSLARHEGLEERVRQRGGLGGVDVAGDEEHVLELEERAFFRLFRRLGRVVGRDRRVGREEAHQKGAHRVREQRHRERVVTVGFCAPKGGLESRVEVAQGRRGPRSDDVSVSQVRRDRIVRARPHDRDDEGAAGLELCRRGLDVFEHGLRRVVETVHREHHVRRARLRRFRPRLDAELRRRQRPRDDLDFVFRRSLGPQIAQQQRVAVVGGAADHRVKRNVRVIHRDRIDRRDSERRHPGF
mmetsp:Transcript_4672/g.19021  ORF Transcript_4672/g.19021 Transcript_4672/m.19021 type:complete len:307 (-) Transcript_4672:367-1287(-)